MVKFSSVARLALVAALASLTLTSCFDRDKKCDPKPKTCGSHGTSSSGSN